MMGDFDSMTLNESSEGDEFHLRRETSKLVMYGLRQGHFRVDCSLVPRGLAHQ